MRNLVAGTAGHIDHGKTSLVRALTGIDADRLKEEKLRGITIDLGFAHLQLTPELRVGFVDVPGHERFIKNMLAGAGGIDLVLFIVAADESIKPQTREHFEICRLLGLRSGIIVLTKADLAGEDLLGLVKLEVEEFVAGSFLEGAPVIAVSSVTGSGISELKQAMAEVAPRVSIRNPHGFSRLPIDRSFSAKGFGTIVTGTLVSGSVAPEQLLELYPTGRTVRVRGVQVFGKSAPIAGAGQRTAVNLAGIEPSEITRGMVLSEPGRFNPVTVIDCSIELLRSAKPLKHRAPVHFHAGTVEIEAEIRLFGGQTAIAPGSTAYARIILRQPALLLPGDRFIIRMFSPVTTIGGGRIADVSGLKYRKTDNVSHRLRVLDTGTSAERVSLLAAESKSGISVRTLSARLALPKELIREGGPSLQLLKDEDWLVASETLQILRRQTVDRIRAFHKNQPLQAGMSKASLGVPEHLLNELLRGAPELVTENDIVRLRGHRVVLKVDETEARTAIENAFSAAGLTVPSLAEVLAQSGIEEKRARAVLQLLLREQQLINVSEGLVFHRSALCTLKEMLAARKGSRFTVAEFKDWTGISRKYAIPLLEYLDRKKITRREGDFRAVL